MKTRIILFLLVITNYCLFAADFKTYDAMSQYNGVHAFDTLNYFIVGDNALLIRTTEGGNKLKRIV